MEAVRATGDVVAEARTEYEALALLSGAPHVLVFDLDLSPGRRSALLQAANATFPVPVRIALVSDILPEEAFQLARRGVRALFRKPPSLSALTAEIERSLREWIDLAPILPDAVGVRTLRAVQETVRDVMIRQALARAMGNRGMAARMLGVSRQAVHQLLRRPYAASREGD